MQQFQTLSDKALLALVQAGDESAYTQIYDRYGRLLYMFAYKRLGDREQVRDLVQDVFLSLWLNRENLELSYSLGTYLHAAVRNKILDIIAHNKVSSRYIESFQLFQASVNTTDHPARQKNLEAIIEKEIAALPKKMRQVFELSRKTELSRKEIAAELGLSEETVKSHLHHALKLLKVKLGAHFFQIFL